MNLTTLVNNLSAVTTFATPASGLQSGSAASASATSGEASVGSASTAQTSTAKTAAQRVAASPLSAIQKRVQTDADSTKTQLSAFGVLKSAVASSQTAAQAATKLSSAATTGDLTKALADVFNGYNGTVSASQNATQSKSASSTDAANASRVGKDFQRAVTGPANSDALKKLGLSVRSDGTLQQDARKFADAVKADPAGVRSALGKLGAAISTTATKELDSSGAVGSAISRLSQRSSSLAAQQKALSSAAQSLAAYAANS